jgi:hypothetical protein
MRISKRNERDERDKNKQKGGERAKERVNKILKARTCTGKGRFVLEFSG